MENVKYRRLLLYRPPPTFTFLKPNKLILWHIEKKGMHNQKPQRTYLFLQLQHSGGSFFFLQKRFKIKDKNSHCLYILRFICKIRCLIIVYINPLPFNSHYFFIGSSTASIIKSYPGAEIIRNTVIIWGRALYEEIWYACCMWLSPPSFKNLRLSWMVHPETWLSLFYCLSF